MIWGEGRDVFIVLIVSILMEVEATIIIQVEGGPRTKVFIQHKIIGIDELVTGRIKEFQLCAGVVSANADASEGSGMEREAVGCGVPGSSDVAHTEEREEVSKVCFFLINEFKRGGEAIIDFKWEVIGDFSGPFKGMKPKLGRHEI